MQFAPVANKPLMEHAIEAARDAGATELGVVVSAGTRHQTARVIGDGSRWDIHVRTIEAPPGFDAGRAVIAAAAFLERSPFVLHPGDQLVGEALARAAADFQDGRLDAALLAADRGPDASSDAWQLHATRLLRTPQVAGAADGKRLTGVGVLSPLVVDTLRDFADEREGPLAVAEAVCALVGDGGRVRIHPTDEWWRHDGDVTDLLEGNRLALAELRRDATDATVVSSEIQGPVHIHPTAVVESTIVRGPVVIGAGTCIRDGYIGPYTSIGADVRIDGAEVENSIVLDGARVEWIGRRLEGSVLGAGSRVFSDFGLPKALRLRVGEGAEICLA